MLIHRRLNSHNFLWQIPAERCVIGGFDVLVLNTTPTVCYVRARPDSISSKFPTGLRKYLHLRTLVLFSNLPACHHKSLRSGQVLPSQSSNTPPAKATDSFLAQSRPHSPNPAYCAPIPLELLVVARPCRCNRWKIFDGSSSPCGCWLIAVLIFEAVILDI